MIPCMMGPTAARCGLRLQSSSNSAHAVRRRRQFRRNPPPTTLSAYLAQAASSGIARIASDVTEDRCDWPKEGGV